MKTLYYNPETKVIFGSEDAQPEGIQTITAIAVPDLVAAGAGVDPSASDLLTSPELDPNEKPTDSTGHPEGAVLAAGDPAASATILDTGAEQELAVANKMAEPSTTAGRPANFEALTAAGEAGNDVGQSDTANSAILDANAPAASGQRAAAGATSANLSHRFETKHYADGSVLRTTGELPAASVVSYPDPVDPDPESPHNLLTRIEEFITKMLGTARTEGHALAAKLRKHLPEQE